MKVNFKYLVDCQYLTNRLANWFHREWGLRNPMLTVDAIEKSLRGRLNRNIPPLTFIAFIGEDPIGSASLKIREMEIYPEYTHWLGTVYVLPEYRNQGIGTQIVEHSISEAKRLGNISELFLYTHDREHFYTKFGWQALKRILYHGREVVVMKRLI
jgi:putative hydrolase of the HAD superfamily